MVRPEAAECDGVFESYEVVGKKKTRPKETSQQRRGRRLRADARVYARLLQAAGAALYHHTQESKLVSVVRAFLHRSAGQDGSAPSCGPVVSMVPQRRQQQQRSQLVLAGPCTHAPVPSSPRDGTGAASSLSQGAKCQASMRANAPVFTPAGSLVPAQGAAPATAVDGFGYLRRQRACARSCPHHCAVLAAAVPAHGLE